MMVFLLFINFLQAAYLPTYADVYTLAHKPIILYIYSVTSLLG